MYLGGYGHRVHLGVTCSEVKEGGPLFVARPWTCLPWGRPDCRLTSKTRVNLGFVAVYLRNASHLLGPVSRGLALCVCSEVLHSYGGWWFFTLICTFSCSRLHMTAAAHV